MGCCKEVKYSCRPKNCCKRCIGTYVTKYKVYENCCYSVYKVCNYCGAEYDHKKYHACPKCGMMMDDPPSFGGHGFGRFGGFGRGFIRGFGRGFGGFPLFGYGVYPEFETEDEDEEFY